MNSKLIKSTEGALLNQWQLYEQVVEIRDFLQRQHTLRPCFQVNKLFQQLVDLVTKYDMPLDVFGVSLKAELNELCAKGEAELEKYWARELLCMKGDAENPLMSLVRKFPYFQNYQDLIDWEAAELVQVGIKPGDRILMVGAGSLPISAILFADRGYKVEIVDNDFEAVHLSVSLLAKMKVDIKVWQADFFKIKNFHAYDLVLIAALVGGNEIEKKAVFEHLKDVLHPGKNFLIRYARGLKALLYQDIQDNWLEKFTDVKQFNPSADLINSFLLAKQI